ncbi:MAG TPA: exopolysaccharide biosynthesis polyprenyl glycosylphosphotransferase [Polyangiaceae bacterium]|jgi:putative colanic acid biosynthesis UDP-glucose lipid carrier transferase
MHGSANGEGTDGLTSESEIAPRSQAHSSRSYRLTALRPSSVPPPPDEPLLRALTDILLAAAQADGTRCHRELRTLRRILKRLTDSDILPDWVEPHIEAFRTDNFDLETAVAPLRDLPREQRRHIIELVREVCDADNAFDLEEERYLLGLMVVLSLSREDVSDLVVHSAYGIDGVVKRLFDVAFAGSFLTATWPLFAAVALGIKVSSPGPVLFKQRRYGQGAEEIEVFKFRTMRVTEDGAVVRQATRGDSRITPFGAFLRRTSLDELPQFFNVLRGDMSVVGPRPHAVAHNQEYRTRILEYMLRHKVKPGITGWAQVNGWRGETDTLEKMVQRVAHDIEYIRRFSLWFDVEIVFRTVFGSKTRQNAY